MAFCSNCGAQIQDGVAFCASCGTKVGKVQTHTTVADAPSTTGKLHCPQCKSDKIQITTESSVTGAVTTHHGGMSSTHMSNEHRNYWICTQCGTKFRNIQNLEEEIAKTKKLPVVYTVITIIALILTIICLRNMLSSIFGQFLFGGLTFGCGLATLIFFIFIFTSKSKLKKLQEELVYLKKNCFD